jgi:hypothetical protein
VHAAVAVVAVVAPVGEGDGAVPVRVAGRPAVGVVAVDVPVVVVVRPVAALLRVGPASATTAAAASASASAAVVAAAGGGEVDAAGVVGGTRLPQRVRHAVRGERSAR